MQFFSVILFLLSFSARPNETFRVQISDIDFGKTNSETLVFLSNGKVAKISPSHKVGLDRLQNYHKARSWVEVTLNSEREILELNFNENKTQDSYEQNFNNDSTYIPSVIPSFEAALQFFKEAKYKLKESQCYNRAYVWGYEWRAKHGLYTSKIWLFFTRKYIRKYNFEWWFHVAPLFHVLKDGEVWERVANVKYAKSLLKKKVWTDIFLRNNPDCPVISTYSDYANYPETGWCYTMKTSMYYYQPLDLELLDKEGVEKNIWNPTNLKEAYKEAFDIALEE